MSKSISFKTVMRPTIVLVAICLVCTFLLAVTNDITAPLIADLNHQNELEARKVVLPEAASFGETKEVELHGKGSGMTPGLDAAGAVVGYVITGDGSGYGGQVRMLVGIDPAGIVTGVKPLVLNETAGLGMKAENPDFLASFIGKSAGIRVTKSQAGSNEIEALTGATITTDAVTTAVNQALDVFAAETTGAGENNKIPRIVTGSPMFNSVKG